MGLEFSRTRQGYIITGPNEVHHIKRYTPAQKRQWEEEQENVAKHEKSDSSSESDESNGHSLSSSSSEHRDGSSSKESQIAANVGIYEGESSFGRGKASPTNSTHGEATKVL
ncbi:hypothetical protein Tco_1200890 [Tanacetum coccineum]